MFSNPIRKRVMEVIDARLVAAQKVYEADVEQLEVEFEKHKEYALNRQVQEIIGKII